LEKIDLIYFKNLGIYSAILGGICAILSLIPIFMPFFSLFFAPFLGCLIPLVLLVVKDGFQSNETKTYTILGGISGLCICFSYLIIFSPLAAIIHLINKNYYDYGIHDLNLFLIALFFVMIASVYVITNCVTGLIAGGIYIYIKDGKNNG